MFRCSPTTQQWSQRAKIDAGTLGGLRRGVAFADNFTLLIAGVDSLGNQRAALLRGSNTGATWVRMQEIEGSNLSGYGYAAALGKGCAMVGAQLVPSGGALQLTSYDSTALEQQLAAKQAAIVAAYEQLEQDAVPLRLAHVDPMGLTVCVGWLGFAACATTPELSANADGKLGRARRRGRAAWHERAGQHRHHPLRLHRYGLAGEHLQWRDGAERLRWGDRRGPRLGRGSLARGGARGHGDAADRVGAESALLLVLRRPRRPAWHACPQSRSPTRCGSTPATRWTSPTRAT